MRRVLVEADVDKVMADVGSVHGRVAERWSAALDEVTDEEVKLAVDLFSRAALINREEAERLRHGRP